MIFYRIVILARPSALPSLACLPTQLLLPQASRRAGGQGLDPGAGGWWDWMAKRALDSDSCPPYGGPEVEAMAHSAPGGPEQVGEGSDGVWGRPHWPLMRA